ncbi:glycosyltransferase involved in cell wall biosynthesis [Parabacteroides sp. PF5-5]|uniref:glycosyltransferase family 2 protein n=1 Tax=unclassified Parabacteroides TaxID=2649774 RepID=UPI00247435F0|nr:MULTISPECIES: glycosyltransferase family 2 protein [unclassified Parabacteroides]MDH6305287.1 glycosyltransferase involved in cell wall biosynthesis [Parabacteroides sp. PH5-39]MDH6316640.1 glycosyltransferase involved in cell wall biosynthesis [Parabacteroides sp. PF5-13]MDH6320180.1 glycosyltransferase involved in cell wall biosynthesis [Parabacteroides sp. PH5-13]MDH6323877.1 glycosyltransferase involved in cell wall biosynthesis [Parabacteroides sp. PH5-8]MDH6327857.1 glycosyltransferas
MKTVAIIVPCHNEEAVIAESYRRIKDVLSSLAYPSEIIYINDGSTDKTRILLDNIASSDPHIKVIHFSRNFGHQPAVTAGINNCTADLAIILDADMQDPPELIPELLALQEKEQANVVYCIRKSRVGEGFFKRISAKMFYKIMNYMSEVQFPLDTGDFRLIDRKIMDEFNRLKEKGKYIRGLISWVGFKQVPYYYQREVRFAGKTKYPIRKMLKFGSNALLYFSKKPLRMVMGLGFLAVLVGIILAIWFTLGKIYGFSNAETGWTSIIFTIIFFGGVQLITVGVLGQYMGILFDEIKARPEYIIEEKRNFQDLSDQ